MKRLNQDRSGSRLQALVCWLAAFALVAVWGCGATVSPEQQEAMAKLRDLGGRINFKRGGYEIDMTRTAIETQDVVHLTKIPNVKTVDLQGTRIGDEAVEHLRAIATLEYVYLQRTMVSRDVAEALKRDRPNVEVNY